MTALSPSDRPAYEANIWKSYAFQFLLSFQLWWPIWVIYLTDMRGFSLTQVSGLEALFWMVIVVSEVPTGAIADRFGRKVSLMLGAACTTAAILVFGIATDYWVVLVSYVAWGIGLTFQSGADSALVFESLKSVGREQDYQRVAGVGWGIFSLGMLGGMLIGAPLAAATDLAFPILISAAISALALFVAATMKEPELDDGEPRLAYGRLIAESGRTIWRSPTVRSMLLLAALIVAATNAASIFAQPLLNKHDVPVGLFGVAQAPMRLAGIIGAVTAYRLTATLGLRTTVIAMPLLLIASYGLLGAWESVYAFGATTSLVLVNSIMFPVTADYLNQRIPSNQRATILSFRQLAMSVTIAAIQPAQGIIADELSLETMFWMTAVFVAVAVPPALFLWLRADSEESAPPAAVAGAVPGG